MDNHHVYISPSPASCGIIELSKIGSDQDAVIYQIASYLYHPARGNPAAMVMWSDVRQSNGASLADSARNFGDVLTSTDVENPKTGNLIRAFVWTPNHEVLKSWYKERKIQRIKSF